MKYVIGVDQGSTKTCAAAADLNGHILGTFRAKGAEHHVDGIHAQMELFKEAVEGVIKTCNLDRKNMVHMYCGLCGIDWDDDAELLEREIRGMGYSGGLTIVNDCIVALRGGTERANAAVICAGTGLNCAVIKEGCMPYIYGYFIEESLMGASGLGRKILDIVFRAHVGRIPKTMLTEKVLSFTGYDSVETLLRADTEQKIVTSELAVLLFRCAEMGDEIAVNTIIWFGRECAKMVSAKAISFGMQNDQFDVVLSGSLFKGPGTLLEDAVRMQIHASCPKAHVFPARYEPVVGSVIEALLAVGQQPVFFDQIEKDCVALHLIRPLGSSEYSRL